MWTPHIGDLQTSHLLYGVTMPHLPWDPGLHYLKQSFSSSVDYQ
jgi:hypothetical protein